MLIAQQREWLEALHKFAKRDIRGQYVEGDPGSWKKTWRSVITPPKNDLVTGRQVLLKEVVYDFDTENWADAKEQGEILVKYLRWKTIPFLLGYSGGKGIHIHIFLDATGINLPEDVEQGITEFEVDVARVAREYIYDQIIKESKVDVRLGKIDRLKVSFSQNSKGSIIREFGCPRPDGNHKTMIQDIPEERPYVSEPIVPTPEMMVPYDIKTFGTAIIKDIRGIIKGKKDAYKRESEEGHPEYNGELANIPCYAQMMRGLPEGVRNLGSFMLARMNRVYGRPQELAEKDLEIFAVRSDYDNDACRATAKSVYSYKEKSGMSCRWIRDTFGHDICQQFSCPMMTARGNTLMAEQRKNILSQLATPAQNLQPISNGHPVDEWKHLQFISENITRFGEITPYYSFRVFLMPMKINLDAEDDAEAKKVYQRIKRDYAKHEEYEQTEYFPWLFVKFDESLYTDATGAMIPAPTRWVLPVADRFNQFELSPPDHPDLLQPAPRYCISKKIYEARDRFELPKEAINQFQTDTFDGRELFFELKATFHYYLDIDDKWTTILALWVMGTHLYRIFRAFPYIQLWAPFGSGKSRAMKIVAKTSHMGEYIANPSAAVTFRGNAATGGTWCVEEVDNLMSQDPKILDKYSDLIAVYNTGYEEGATVPRYDLDLKKMVNFEAYAPRIFATTKGFIETMDSRSLKISILRSTDIKYVKREPYDDLDSLKKLQRRLVFWSIDIGSKLASMDVGAVLDKYEKNFSDAPLRLLQLMKPLLAIYEFLHLDEDGPNQPNQRQQLADAIDDLSTDKQESAVKPRDHRILEALYKAAAVPGDDVEITTSSIMALMEFNDESERKSFTAQSIGMALRPFAIPKKCVNTGKTLYFAEKHKPMMNKVERLTFMRNLMARYSMAPDETSQYTKEQKNVRTEIAKMVNESLHGCQVEDVIRTAKYADNINWKPTYDKMLANGELTMSPDGKTVFGRRGR